MAEPLTPERIFDTFTAYQRTAALAAAIELDVFTAIASGADTTSELARRCRAAERGIRSLCDWLCVHGFLTKAQGRYRLPDAAARHLVRGAPGWLGGALEFLTCGELRDAFDRVTEAVQGGGTALADGGTTSHQNPAWVRFARAMEPLARPLAAALVDALAEDAGARPPERVLDVAAGHGRYGIELAERHPGCRVVALDWPQVLEVARENATAAGVGERVELLEGSAFDVDWPDGFDLVLLVNFLHHFDANACTELLRKARGALRDGGRVAVVEAVVDQDRVTPDHNAAFSLVMLATTPHGDAYTAAEYRAMFAAAGFADVTLTDLPDAPQRVLVATR